MYEGAVPLTFKTLPMVVEPLMLTLPRLSTLKSVVVAAPLVEDAITKKVLLKAPLLVVAEKMEKSAPVGVEEPMPTRPTVSMTKVFGAKAPKLVPVVEPTTNCGAPLRMLLPFTERSAHGVVEAIPTLPPVVAK